MTFLSTIRLTCNPGLTFQLILTPCVSENFSKGFEPKNEPLYQLICSKYLLHFWAVFVSCVLVNGQFI